MKSVIVKTFFLLFFSPAGLTAARKPPIQQTVTQRHLLPASIQSSVYQTRNLSASQLTF